MFTLVDASIIFPTFLLAGFVKGVIGLGLPAVAVGLLGLVMPPAEAAALLIVPSMVTNVWQLAIGPHLVRLVGRLWPMLVCLCVGTAITSGALIANTDGRASILLGLALMAYASFGLSSIRLHVPARAEIWLGPVVGIATGLVTGSTGVSAIPSAPYLAALGLDRDDLVQSLGLAFTVSTAALAVVVTAGGFMQAATLGRSALAVVPALAGLAAGTWVRGRVAPLTFRRCFFVGLLLLGADLAARRLF